MQLPPPSLAEHVKAGIRAGGRHADRVQHHRGLRRHHDGHRGHEGVARVSREVIADSIELVAPRPPVRRDRSRSARLRQDHPRRARWRSRRLDVPGRDALRRLDRARHFRGRDVTIHRRSFEAVGAHAAGDDDRRANCTSSRTSRMPRRRRLRRAVHRQHDGQPAFEFSASRRWARTASPRDSTGRTRWRAVGASWSDRHALARATCDPRQIITSEALENADRRRRRYRRLDQRACCTCLAVAREIGVHLSRSTTSTRMRPAHAADRRPAAAGRPVRRHDLYHGAAACALVATAARGGMLYGASEPTVQRQDARREAADGEGTARPQVRDNARASAQAPTGGLVILAAI